MTEDEAKVWVKDKSNKQKVLKLFYDKYKPTSAKIAFFMAGIPGAGKTEFAEYIIREASPSLLPIEHDKLVEYIDSYRAEEYYNYRKAGSTLVTYIFENALKFGYSFIFDGTLSHEAGIRNINRALRAGYTVYVVYIVQDARLAWELTKARELVKKRAIEKQGFIETCNRINQNLELIMKSFTNNTNFNFWILNKQGSPGMENASAIIHGSGMDKHEEIEKELSKLYNLKVIE